MLYERAVPHRDRKVLFLNADYTIIDVITWQRAITLIWRERAKLHEEYEDSTIAFGRSFIQMPSIILATEYKGMQHNYKKVLPVSKKNVLIRDNHTCLYCGEHISDSQGTIDHVLPRSKKGKNTWENVVAACFCCNQKKDNKTPEEAKMKLLRKPFVPTKSIYYRKYCKMDEYASWRPYLSAKSKEA